MHIGCCENCRYLDLVENVTGVCPRCGANIVSLGVETAAWNRTSEPDRQKMIAAMFEKAGTGATDIPATAEAAPAQMMPAEAAPAYMTPAENTPAEAIPEYSEPAPDAPAEPSPEELPPDYPQSLWIDADQKKQEELARSLEHSPGQSEYV